MWSHDTKTELNSPSLVADKKRHPLDWLCQSLVLGAFPIPISMQQKHQLLFNVTVIHLE